MPNTEDKLKISTDTRKELMAFNNAVGTSWTDDDPEEEFECAEEAQVAVRRMVDHFTALEERASAWVREAEDRLPED